MILSNFFHSIKKVTAYSKHLSTSAAEPSLNVEHTENSLNKQKVKQLIAITKNNDILVPRNKRKKQQLIQLILARQTREKNTTIQKDMALIPTKFEVAVNSDG